MPSSDRGEQEAAGAEGRQASAQRDALLELLSVLAHDLNNPLQTLLVLSELALDDSAEGSEAHDRARQCLAAADRLKVLTQAMGSSLRGRPQDVAQLWSRVAVMLGRRLERYGIVVTTDFAALGTTPLSGDAEWALLVAALAVIATGASSSMRRHELAIAGQLRDGQPSVVLALGAVDAAGTRTPWPLEPAALARLRDAVASTSVEADGLQVRIELPRAV